MLETLVSSRIRRTLFEHVLTHPNERFYLRGLAKTLHLPISPLRRELIRLERSAMLSAEQEGNMRFYTVNTASAAFRQLQHAGQSTEAPSSVAASDAAFRLLPSILPANPEPPRPASNESRGGRAPSPTPIPIGVISAGSTESFWRSNPNGPALIGAVGLGIALVFLIISLGYLTMTKQRMVVQVSRMLTTHKTEVTVVAPSSSSSGTMHGARWQIVPGGFGGFSSGASQ